MSLHRWIRDSLCDLFLCGLPSREKHLEKIFKIWSRDFGDLLAGQSSHEKRVLCTNRVKYKTVFKNFSVFPRITCTLIVLSTSPSPKISIFTHKTSIFFTNPSSIFKKRYGFSLIFNLFQVSRPSFLGFCVYVEICKYGC